MNATSHHFMQHIRRPRLLSASLIGIIVFGVLAQFIPLSKAMLIAFDIGAFVFLVLIARVMTLATPQSMRHRAIVQNENNWAVLITCVLISGAVLGALASELHAAKVKSILDLALASSSIFFAWLFVAVMFSQHYAHDYYITPQQLTFPGTEQPDYWDFIYFSITLSMCCQTSDVAVTSSAMRKIVVLHGLLSFFFNVVIIAMTVNLVAGML